MSGDAGGRPEPVGAIRVALVDHLNVGVAGVAVRLNVQVGDGAALLAGEDTVEGALTAGAAQVADGVGGGGGGGHGRCRWLTGSV